MTPEPAPSAAAIRGRGRLLAVGIGALVALAYLLLALPLLRDYGPTWDCVAGDYPHGDRLVAYLESGDERFLDLEAREPRPVVRAPHADFDSRRFGSHMVYSVGPLMSGLACRWVWTEGGLFGSIPAHNLPVLLFAALLLFELVRFTAARVSVPAALAAAAFLLTAPRFFAHSFNNLKDVPEAALYTLAAFSGYTALESGRRSAWILCGAWTGLALAQKANALFLPLQLLLFLVVARLLLRDGSGTRPAVAPRQLALAGIALVIAYYGVSPAYWSDPIGGPAARLAEVFRAGLGEGAGHGSVSLNAPLRVLWTTPLALLVCAALALFRSSVPPSLRLFLAIGVFIPVARNLLPGLRNFDGVRHFLEFLPPLAVLGGAGLAGLVGAVERVVSGRVGRRIASAGVVVALVGPGALIVVRTHPHGTSAFNRLAGGLEGAQGRGLSDATDYWAGSYWQGLAWLSENASRDAVLLVPVAEHVARAAAPERLRPDVSLRASTEPFGEGDLYVMFVTREAFYTPALFALVAQRTPVHRIDVQGAPILLVYRLDSSPADRLLRDQLGTDAAGHRALGRLANWLASNPKLVRELRAAVRANPDADPAELAERWQASFPEALREFLQPALRYRLLLERGARARSPDQEQVP